MSARSAEQNIYYTLRLAVAMCFIGHGAFGVITKPIWCNFFAILGIGQDLAYQLMPPVGILDILMGIIILIYPIRAIFGWLVFWGLLSIAQERKVTVAARAVAGLSAAVCTACGIEPVAIQPVDPEDTTNFGFSPNTRYTLGYSCTAGNQPTPLGGSDTRIPFILINRYNESATLFPDESSQAFRIGAGGLPGDANRLNSCLQIGTSGDVIWASAAPLGCNQPKSGTVTAFNCGLAARFDSALTTGCDTFASAADIITAYTSDSDITDLDDYAAYTGSTRRIITVAVVESIAATDGLTVMGFRQFLIQPDQGGINITPTDNNGRFIATYLGYPMPLKQGYNGTCGVSLGPGKVVLHQ